jgi:hypothetical protein
MADIIAKESVSSGKNIFDLVRSHGVNPVKAGTLINAVVSKKEPIDAEKKKPSDMRARAMEIATKKQAAETLTTGVDNAKGEGKISPVADTKPDTKPDGGGKMTTELPKLTGSEKQVAFAEKVRPSLLSKIQSKIDTLKKRAALVAAESGPQRIIDSANQDIAIMQQRHDSLATMTSAAKILDAKDTDFTNTSSVVADLIDKKAGLTAKVGA